MEGLTQPTLLLKPFAQSGTKNTLPDVNTDTSNPQKADLTNGFPAITSLEPDDGGLPPERADLNGLGYLTTAYDYFYQAGGTFTFDQTISTAIGGYPLGARLWYFDGTETYILRSTKNDNNDNFITTPSFIGTSWVKDTPTRSDIDACMNKNASNATSTAKESVAGWVVPNYSAITSYVFGTAVPSKGWVCVSGYSYDYRPYMAVNGTVVMPARGGNYGGATQMSIMVDAGDIITTDAGGNKSGCTFIPVKGA